MTDIKTFLTEVLGAPENEASKVQVTLTFAQSIDAKIAGRNGQQIALSCQESMKMTHRLRSLHDAILIGIGTALNDNPQLNTRLLSPEDGGLDAPLPIILDSNLAFPVDSKLVKNYKFHAGRQPIIVTREGQPEKDTDWGTKRSQLEAEGLKVITIPSDSNGRLHLPTLLERLHEMKIRTLMVEGGARVIVSFMDSGLVDRLIITTSPHFIGAGGVGYDGHNKDSQLEFDKTVLVGRDAVMVWKRR